MPPSEPTTGAIYDIGYQHYDGKRLGRAGAIRALYVQGLRTVFGIGRGGKAKIPPIALIAIMVIPALIQAALSRARQRPGADHFACRILQHDRLDLRFVRRLPDARTGDRRSAASRSCTLLLARAPAIGLRTRAGLARWQRHSSPWHSSRISSCSLASTSPPSMSGTRSARACRRFPGIWELRWRSRCCCRWCPSRSLRSSSAGRSRPRQSSASSCSRAPLWDRWS